MKKFLLLGLGPGTMIAFGALLNLLAITANNGLMPVLTPQTWPVQFAGQVLDPRHISWSPHVQYAIICDWIQWFDGSVCSIGDLFMWLGVWLQWPGIAAYTALLYFRATE